MKEQNLSQGCQTLKNEKQIKKLNGKGEEERAVKMILPNKLA